MYLTALLNALDVGMVLFLISAGLSLVFGVMGVLNFAHGSLYMLGAYLTYSALRLMAFPFWASVGAAALAVGLCALGLERALVRRVYRRHVTHQLLLTFAVLLIINELVRMVWGSGYLVVDPPAALAWTVRIGNARYPLYNLTVVAVGVVLGVALWQALHRTRLGRMVRAAALDREMAEALGINVRALYTGVFAGAGALAALAGALAAPMRAIGPAMGDRVIIDAFIVTVIGGLGSFPGAMVGALMLGFLHAFGSWWFPQLDIAFPFALMAIILVLRPQGLFGSGAR